MTKIESGQEPPTKSIQERIEAVEELLNDPVFLAERLFLLLRDRAAEAR